jgi:creatinine amidohydrolase
MALPTKFWAEMAWTDFRDADMGAVIAVLPVAAIEQHGPHLPVGVDSFIMEGYLRAAIERLPDDLPVLVLPLQAIGKSNEHVAFPGTLTFSTETVIRAWQEIGESVHRAGVRKLVLVNSHGGNIPALDIVARELRVRLTMLAVVVSWSRFGYPETLFSAAETIHGIHSGAAETSLMLAFRPELVRHAAMRNFVPNSVAIAEEFTQLRVTQPIGFGWMAQDVGPDGAMGDAASGTSAKGAAACQHGADAFVDLLRDVERFDLARLAPGMRATEPAAGR